MATIRLHVTENTWILLLILLIYFLKKFLRTNQRESNDENINNRLNLWLKSRRFDNDRLQSRYIEWFSLSFWMICDQSNKNLIATKRWIFDIQPINKQLPNKFRFFDRKCSICIRSISFFLSPKFISFFLLLNWSNQSKRLLICTT